MEEIKNLKPFYKNGTDNIGNDFLKPCLKNCVMWRRGTLGFSSSALKTWAGSFTNILENVQKIEILADISHVSDKQLVLALEHNASEEEKRKTLIKHSEKIILTAIGADMTESTPREYIWKLLHYLLASEILEIRFATNTITTGNRNLYHPKGGYFLFENGEAVAHDGSFNESESGHQFNNETVHVFHKSKEEDRFIMVQRSVDEDWFGNDYVKVSKLSKEVMQKIKLNAPKKFPKPPSKASTNEEHIEVKKINIPEIPETLWGQKFELREHQDKAYKEWIRQEAKGILWHATGSGKTITSLYALSKVALAGNKFIAIIHVPFTPLADQWIEELKKFNLHAIKCYGSSVRWTNELEIAMLKFVQAEKPFVQPLVVIDKTFFMKSFQEILEKMDNEPSNNIFYICDECHRFAKKDRTKKLPNATFKMGLSGTPFNSEDNSSIGDIELINYFGEVCDKYEIAEAMADKVLTQYDYIPIKCYLNDDELEEVRELERKIGQGGFDEDGMPTEASNIASGFRNRLLAKVEDKFDKFIQLIDQDDVKSKKEQSLFFVGDGSTELDLEQNDGTNSDVQIKVLEKFGKILADRGWGYKQFTAGESSSERANIINDFKDGHIDAILAIRILDEGIDLPGVMKAFLLASTSNRRQFVQRRGRILRRAEGKEKAVIYDFIVLPPEGENCSFVRREVDRLIEIGQDSLPESKNNSVSLVNELINSYKVDDNTFNKAKNYIDTNDR